MEVLVIIAKILTLVGSLGVFLFGMKLMSDSLQKVAGSKMREILGKMTSNRFSGILTGAFVTTTIQSSSATTVMLVSFVNAGLLTLVGAIGVIMGANIGTTVTAWVISLLGFKVKMEIIAIPLVALVLPLVFSKNQKRKSWGEFVVGFAILFLGLGFLKDSVPNMQEYPEVLAFIAQFSDMGVFSILLFVIIGSVFTVIIQSSSATMALTIVMCYNGLIPFDLAAAMVLGENIGTTVTANIAAIVGNISAKRTARAHTLFNLIGVFWILLIFPWFLKLVDYVVIRTEGVSAFVEVTAIPVALSIFHSSFNIINTLVLVWFVKLFERIVIKLVPYKDDDEEFRLRHINFGLFSTPELDIVQAEKEIAIFAKRSHKMFGFIPELLVKKKEKKYLKIMTRLRKYEDILDRMEVEIARYLTKVAEGNLSPKASKRIRCLLRAIDNIESAGDICYQMGKTIESKNDKKIWYAPEQRENIEKIFGVLNEAFLHLIAKLEGTQKSDDVLKAIELERTINTLREEFREQHIDSIKNAEYPYETGISYNQMILLAERLGDYIFEVHLSIADLPNDEFLTDLLPKKTKLTVADSEEKPQVVEEVTPAPSTQIGEQ